MTLEQALNVLDLAAPFTPTSLKKAYRQAILVWHPDRFQDNPELQAKAEARTCAINEAYSVLDALLGGKEMWTPPVRSPSPPCGGHNAAATMTEAARHAAVRENTERTHHRPQRRSSSRLYLYIFGGIILFLLVNGIGMYLEFGGKRPHVDSPPVDLQADHQAAWKRISKELQETERQAPKLEIPVRNPNIEALGVAPKAQEPSPSNARTPEASDQPVMLPLPTTPAAKLVVDGQLRHLPWENRPESGTVLTNLLPQGGRGVLVLDNSMDEDAHVKIIASGQMVASFYVQGGQKFTFKGIPDGIYGIMYRKGYGWNPAQRAFGRGMAAAKYDKALTFAERTEKQGSQVMRYWDVMNLTLHKVQNGNASTTDVPPDEFDRY